MKRRVYAVAVVLGAILFGAMVASRPVTGQPTVTRPDVAVNVKSFGAKGDGITDDRAAIQAAIGAVPAAGGQVVLPAGTYSVGSTVTLRNNVTLAGAGQGLTVVKATAASTAAYVVTGANLTGAWVSGLTIHVNGTARAANAAAMGGLILTTCTDSGAERVTVTDSLGSVGGTAVAFGLAGTGVDAPQRCRFVNCLALDCGTNPRPSDGFYCGGNYTLVVGCQAIRCKDTGVVLETCNHSMVNGFTAEGCGTVAAVTTFGTNTSDGNGLYNVYGKNWFGTVLGGVAVGVLASGSADLTNTTLGNVTLIAPTSTVGLGPGVNVQGAGTGRTKKLTITGLTVDGAGTQGVALANVDGATIQAARIGRCTTPLLVQSGCTDIDLDAAEIAPLGASSIGASVVKSTNVNVRLGRVVIDAGNTTHCVYGFDAGGVGNTNLSAFVGQVTGAPSVAYFGADAQTLPSFRALRGVSSGRLAGLGFGVADAGFYYDPATGLLTAGVGLTSSGGVSGTTGIFSAGVQVPNVQSYRSVTSGGTPVNLLRLTNDASNITRFLAGVDAGGFQWANQGESVAWLGLTGSAMTVSVPLSVGGGTGITKHLSATGSLDFPSVAASGTAELTITVTGAASGDVCYASPTGAPESGLVWSAYVSGANTVTVRLANHTAGAIDPAARTWRADVWQH